MTEIKWPGTPEDARRFLRKVLGAPRRRYFGKEKEELMTMLLLVGNPTRTNNQRFFTDIYEVNGRTFHHTHGGIEDDILEEILPDDFQQD